MNRRKLALLIALSVLLIVLAAVTATTAWEVLGAGYEVAGDGVSLVMLLLFLTYADAELVLFLREKFEGEKKGSISRKVVLLYLLMLLLLIFIGIAYFGAHRGTTETVDSLRDGDVSSIPPEMEEEIFPQDLIEEEKTGEEESSVETPIGEGTPYEEPEEQEETVVEEEEETLSVVSDDAEQVEEEKDTIPAGKESMDEEGKTITPGDMEEIRVPSTPEILYYIPRLYEVVPPSVPELSVSSSELVDIPVPEVPSISVASSEVREIPVPSVPSFSLEPSAVLTEKSAREQAEEDFWATFYIAGEDELLLADGIYYMDLYLNDNYAGVVTTMIENEKPSILKNEVMGYVDGLLTDEAFNRLDGYKGDYFTLDYLEEMDVDTEFDSAEYRIDLYFNPSDMPIQTISIRGSGFRMTRRPISGAPTLDPATFVLRSRYNLNASFDIYPTEDFLPSLYFTFNSYNEARLKDVYFVFNYNMNFTPDYFRFSLGNYYFYHDFEDSMIRLAVGNVSGNLLSLPGTNIGIRFDKAYQYGPNGARRSGNIERMLYVEKESDVRIYNEGREIFRRTLDAGSYRLTDFLLYSGANHVLVVISPLDGSAPTEIEMDINYASSLLSVGEIYYGASLTTARNMVSSFSTKTEGAFRIPLFNGRSAEYDLRDLVLSGYIEAGVTENLTLDLTLAAMNNATNNSAFNPSLSAALAMTHANVLGTTRYNINASSIADGFGNMTFNELYLRASHQVATRMRALSGVNLSLTYRLNSEFENRLSGSLNLSGAFSIFSWSLGLSGTYAPGSTSSWTTSGSLSLNPARGLRFSASVNASGTFDGNPNVYGRVYGSYSFGGANINANASTKDVSVAASYYNDRHSVYTRMYSNNYLDGGIYSLNADYSYRGNIFDFSAAFNAYDLFNQTGYMNRGSGSLSLSTSSVFADGLLAFSSSIPSDFILIKQKGALKGNTLSVGSVGSSVSQEIKTVFNTGMYTGISSNSALTFYSQDEDSLLGGESFDYVIPDTKHGGYALRLEAEKKFSSAVFATLPDGTPWINESSPLSKVTITDEGIDVELTEDYVFSDGMGIIINNSLEPGLYGFDVRVDGEWYLYIFSVEDMPDEDASLVQMKENITPSELTVLSDAYSGAYIIESTEAITAEAFWNILYPMEVAV